MDPIVEGVVSGAGLVLVAIAMNDIFHTLWQPQGQGSVSGAAIRLVWKASKRFDTTGRVAKLTGPFAMVMVIGTWALLVIVGWALVYWPHLPESFTLAQNLEPRERADVVDALYLSLVSVTTLGFGDVVPTSAAMRIAVPVQAMMGFGLLTAAVSWVLQVYPALTRSRSLSRWIAALRDTGSPEEVLAVDGAATAVLLTDLARRIIDVHVDLEQYAETYYYRSGSERSSLASTVGYARQLAEAAGRSARPDVRMAGSALTHALEDLGRALARFLPTDDRTTAEILDAYTADHGF